jgi:hypothetical protein
LAIVAVAVVMLAFAVAAGLWRRPAAERRAEGHYVIVISE